MRYIFIILLWLTFYPVFAQKDDQDKTDQPQTAQPQSDDDQSSSNNLLDTATMNALKDSMNSKISQVFDIDMLMQCFQVRQLSSIGAITLLTKNKALADTVNKFEKDYEVNLMVHSFIDSKQFWPKLLFNKTKLTDWTSNTKNKPGVGFDIKFTPYGTGWLNRTFKAEIDRKSKRLNSS